MLTALTAATTTAVTLAMASCNAKPPNAFPAPQPGSLVPCTTTAPRGPERTLDALPPTAAATTGTAIMTIDTNLGTIEIDIDRSKVPCTTAFLTHLGKMGFYEADGCHRLTTEGIFVLQCGDPNEDGTGGPGFGYETEGLLPQIPRTAGPTCMPLASGAIVYRGALPSGLPNDFPTDFPTDWLDGTCFPLMGATDYADQHYDPGTVGMANTGQSGTTGSQFFFAYRDFVLPSRYTILGHVRTGLDIILKVAADGTLDGSIDGKPRTRLVISKVTIR